MSKHTQINRIMSKSALNEPFDNFEKSFNVISETLIYEVEDIIKSKGGKGEDSEIFDAIYAAFDVASDDGFSKWFPKAKEHLSSYLTLNKSKSAKAKMSMRKPTTKTKVLMGS